MTQPKEPAFAEPWHAQIFALTVHLSESGRFTWPDWAERFGATLARHGLARDLDGGDDYFTVWLEALETFMAETGAAPVPETAEARARWEAAYLRTPHGQPVRIDDA